MFKCKKFTGLLLVAVMLISVTACGGKAPSNLATTKMEPYAPYSKPIIITVGRIVDGGVSIPGETSQNNGLLTFLQKKLNVQYKVAWEAIPQEYDQKLSLSIASDTLPDVYNIQEGTMFLTFQQLAKAGKLADLTESWNKCWGGFDKQAIAQNPASLYDPLKVNGKLYMLGGPSLAFNDINLLWVRKDWMDKVGITTLPKTIEDVEKLGKAFVDNKLGKNGKTVGIAIPPATSGNDPSGPWGKTYAGIGQVAEALGAHENYWTKGSDGNVVYGSVMPQMKDALTVMNRWYTEKILDPQWATYKSMDDALAVLNAGSAGMIFAPWWFPYVSQSMLKTEPGVQWVPVAAPLDANGKFNCADELTFTPVSGIVVNAKCKYPEAIIKSINLCDDVILHVYDKDPTYAPILKPEIDGKVGLWPVSPFGNSQFCNVSTVNIIAGQDAKKYIDQNGSADFKFNPLISPADVIAFKNGYTWSKTKDISNAGGWADYTSKFFGQIAYQDPAVKTFPVAWTAPTESMGSLKPITETLLVTAFTQMICGQKPLSDFDKVVSDWKSKGGDTMTKEVQTQVDNLKK